MSLIPDLQRVKAILRIVAVNICLILAGVLVLELLFGGWLDSNRLNRLNLLRDVQLERDVSGLYQSPNPIIHYSRDQHGLRGTFASPDKIDILTVGGSATDERYLDDSETWQEVMRQQFQLAEMPLTIVNAGVDGQSTYGHNKNFEYWFPLIPDLAPHYILFYIGVNDFHIDSRYKYDDLQGHEQNLKTRIRNSYRKNSAIHHLYRSLKGTFDAMAKKKLSHRRYYFDRMSWSRQPLQADYTFMQPRLDAYGERLRSLVQLTLDMGAVPIFVSQPSYWYRMTPHGLEGVSDTDTYDGREINGVDRYHMMRLLDGVTGAVAAESGILWS